MKSDKKKAVRNNTVASRLKTLDKKFIKCIEAGNAQDAQSQAKVLSRAYDKAAALGVIPKGRASRRKSRIALAVKRTASK